MTDEKIGQFDWLMFNICPLIHPQLKGQGCIFNFAQFDPGTCSLIIKWFNIMEHFAGWKFCFRGSIIPMKFSKHMKELCFRSMPLEQAPGAKPFVCFGFNSLFPQNISTCNHRSAELLNLLNIFGLSSISSRPSGQDIAH